MPTAKSAASKKKGCNGASVSLSVVLDQGTDRPRYGYVAGSTLRGSVVLRVEAANGAAQQSTVAPPTSEETTTLHAAALRLYVEGTETHLERSREACTDVHLARTITLAGVPLPGEVDEERIASRQLQEYLVRNGRRAPLTGVVLSTHPAEAMATSSQVGVHAIGQARYLPQPGNGESASPPGASDEGATAPLLPPSSSYAGLELTVGQTYRVPFTFQLPPWLPPSFYYHVGEMLGSLRYTVVARLDGTGGTTTTTDTTGAREIEAAGTPTIFYIISSIPKRELLQCQERAGLRPPFTQQLRFHAFRAGSVVRLFSRTVQSTIDIRVRFLSSAALVLSDRYGTVGALFGGGDSGAAPSPAVVTGSSAADGGGGGGSPKRGAAPHTSDAWPGSRADVVGQPQETTVMGAVVGRAASPELTSPTLSDHSATANLPKSTLRFRLTLANGNPAAEKTGCTVEKIRVELMERIHVKQTSGRYPVLVDPQVLCSQELKGKVPFGARHTFDVTLSLPARFRRGKEDERGALPPPGMETSLVSISTWLSITLPSTNAVVEKELPENVILLAEMVDLADQAPVLPLSLRTIRPPT